MSRIALVTGGTRGIGEAISKALQDAGRTVVATYAHNDTAAQAFAQQTALVPLGRGPRPEEIADAVLYLAGARSVTGVTIAVDGGQHIAWQTPDATGIEE